MAEDEGKAQRHAELAAEHTRKAQFHESHAEGASVPGAQKSTGGQMGDFFGAIMEHKWWVIGGVAALILFAVVILPALQGNSQSTANQGNAAPNDAAGQFVPSNISTALDNINTAISGLANQIGNGPSNPPPVVTPPTGIFPPVGTPPPIPVPPAPPPPVVHPPPPQPPPRPTPQPPPSPERFFTVTHWPDLGGSLWGIAQLNHISLARIEQLNPQYASNWNLIYPGQKVRIA